MKKIFITGGTGFIGRELLKELSHEQVQLYVLVRSKDRALQKLDDISLQNIHLVIGDLTKGNLGLSSEDWNTVLGSNMIIHAGGPMDIQVGEKEALSSFLDGARHIAELAKEIHQTKTLDQFIHLVGYMSPFHNRNSNVDIDVFTEGESYIKIKNPYEKTKFLADLYIRQQALKIGYPLSVINPPVVVGSSKTGSTEQMGGLGLLVTTMRKGLMPVIPGGEKYRLPLMTNDRLSSFIKSVVMQEAVSIQTYTLVPDKTSEPDMPELLALMSESLNVAKPSISVPIEALKLLMKSGMSKLAKLPAESLNFITKKEFTNHSCKKLMGENWFQNGRIRDHLSLVVADLDYRLTHPNYHIDKRYTRSRIGRMAVYQLIGKGKPVVLIHGLLSDGADLFPFGLEIHKKTGQPIWIIDLPGFGRSPFIKNSDLLDVYLETIKMILDEAVSGAQFIGHSFGALLLMEAMNKNIIRNQDTLILLQPPITKRKEYIPSSTFVDKLSLKWATLKRLEKYFIKQGLFIDHVDIPYDYLVKVKRSTTSPRILNTTVQVNTFLTKMIRNDDYFNQNQPIHIIWGNKDRAYSIPLLSRKIDEVPYGHHFPISHPKETAEIICGKWLESVINE